MRILLAEDNPLNQRLIQIMFKKLQHDIILAENGLIAVEKFQNDRFDLILMDIMMPEMNGIDATKNIRQIEKENNLEKTPIIALTGNDRYENDCYEAGMCFFMTKPFQINIFHEIVDKIRQYKNI